MAPKKKSKASKFAKMTEEEKARYLQHRAAIEEEARRRKQELVFTFLKSKFKKEEAFARINLAKINQQWRQILRKVKIVEMKKEIEALQQSFERLVIRKDHNIKNLLQGLKEAEDQYRRNLQSQICATDRLIALQDERLKTLQKIYITEKSAMMRQKNKMLKEITASNKLAQEQMHLIIYAGEVKFQKTESDEKAEYITRNNEMKNQVESEHCHFKLKIEATTGNLWKIYQNTIQEYFSSTEERRKQYSTLKAKDDLNCAIIQRQTKRLEDGEKLTQKLKDHLALLQRSYDKTLNELKQERQEYATHFYQLKNKSSQLEKFDKEQIAHLSTISNNAATHLEKLIKKAEKILHLAQSCRRFETLEEKVIKQENKVSTEGPHEDIYETIKMNISDYKGLEGFWTRFNKVLMESATLKLHYSALTIENEQLKAALKHYMCSISTSSHFISGGDRRNGDKNLIKQNGAKPNMIESSSKKLISRKDYYQNLPRPVTSIEDEQTEPLINFLKDKLDLVMSNDKNQSTTKYRTTIDAVFRIQYDF